MTQPKTKILILEDQSGHYQRIKNRLEEVLSDQVVVLPDMGPKRPNPEFFGYLIQLAKDREFDKIRAIPDIDIFIIDNTMITNDDIGAEFRNDLFNANYRGGNFFIVFISSTPKSALPISTWDNTREVYVSKLGQQRYLQEAVLVEVLNHLGTSPEELARQVPERADTIITTVYGGFKKHSDWAEKDELFHVRLDRLICYFFYILLALTALYACINIIKDFGKYTFENVVQAPKAIGVTDKLRLDPEEQELLKDVEQIYLYLLPVFIVFGFFNYYMTNKRLTLLGGNEWKIDTERSTKTMRLTKILVISSMISYVVIKGIQELFSDQPELTKLIGSGALIAILMFYFAFLEKQDRDSTKDQKP